MKIIINFTINKQTLLNVEDNDEVENDSGKEYERIYDEEECNIDEIEATEEEQDKAPKKKAFRKK
jgi:hypothetical protein